MRSLFVSLWRNRHLIAQFTWRDIVGRYRGSYFGILWSFAIPLAMVAIFSFVFGTVFGARWTSLNLRANASSFAVPMFAGLLVYTFVSECATRAPSLIVGNPNFVKRVVFPLETLCVSSVAAALFHAAVGFAVLIVWMMVTGATTTATSLWVPVIWLPLAAFSMGLSLFLAALGVFFRDIAQIIGLVMTALMFLAPITYPLSAIPKEYLWVISSNPLTPFVEMTRGSLVLGLAPPLGDLTIAFAIALVALSIGSWVFWKTRRSFADLL